MYKSTIRNNHSFYLKLFKFQIWPERRFYDEMQSEDNNFFQNNVTSLQKSIEAGIKAQAQNRRQRVQGSYDYESELFFILCFYLVSF